MEIGGSGRNRLDFESQQRRTNRTGHHEGSSSKRHSDVSPRATCGAFTITRTQMRISASILVGAVLLLLIAPRSPAPIIEETPAPPTKQKAQAKVPAKTQTSSTAETGMSSRSVQVVLTDKTRATMLYLKNRVQQYESQPLAGKSDVHPDEILEQLRRVLSTRFRNVSISESNSTSRSGGLTMLFELQANVGTISFTTNTVSFTATFKSSGGQTIQTISASGKSMVPYPGFFGTQFSKAVTAVFTDFSQKLAAAR